MGYFLKLVNTFVTWKRKLKTPDAIAENVKNNNEVPPSARQKMNTCTPISICGRNQRVVFIYGLFSKAGYNFVTWKQKAENIPNNNGAYCVLKKRSPYPNLNTAALFNICWVCLLVVVLHPRNI